MRIAILAPHIFMHKDILPKVIFSPGDLAIGLVKELIKKDIKVYFFSPGYDIDGAENIHPDMSFFEKELELRGYGYVELLKKHPLTFISIARQVQAELISKVYEMGNKGEFDLIHSYMNEEDTALIFANHSKVPVVFTHSDPFNFYPRYRSIFPKYKHLPFISMSFAQRKNMPEDTNWVGNVYHGIESGVGDQGSESKNQKAIGCHFERSGAESRNLRRRNDEYFAYLGRIVEAKGVHLAIQACKKARVDLKIAGKHYSGGGKNDYWEEVIQPKLENSKKYQIKTKNQNGSEEQGISSNSELRTHNSKVEYVGFIKDEDKKRDFLSNAKALLVPSVFDEPFGLVMIEALACGTPVIGLDSGAIPEVVEDGVTGLIVKKSQKSKPKAQIKTKDQKLKTNSELVLDEERIIDGFVSKIKKIDEVDRKKCREEFEKRFTIERMAREHVEIYKNVLKGE